MSNHTGTPTDKMSTANSTNSPNSHKICKIIEKEMEQCKQHLCNNVFHALENSMSSSSSANDSNSDVNSSSLRVKDGRKPSSEDHTNSKGGGGKSIIPSSRKPSGGGGYIKGGAPREAITPPSSFLETFKNFWYDGASPQLGGAPQDPILVNECAEELPDEATRRNKFFATLDILKRLEGAERVFHVTEYPQKFYDRMMVYICMLLRSNTNKLSDFVMGNPRKFSSITESSSVYKTLLLAGFVPLALELHSPSDKPIRWVASETYDFMSILRQQICLYTRSDNGRVHYYYDPLVVNRNFVSVIGDNKLAEQYVMQHAADKKERDLLEKREGITLSERGIDQQIDQGQEQRRKRLLAKLEQRTTDMMNALEIMNEEGHIPSRENVRKQLINTYKCNGVDPEVGSVNTEENEIPSGLNCVLLSNKRRSKELGIPKTDKRWRPLQYKFRSVGDIGDWPVKQVWELYQPDGPWSHTQGFVDVLTAIREDVDEVRIESRYTI